MLAKELSGRVTVTVRFDGGFLDSAGEVAHMPSCVWVGSLCLDDLAPLVPTKRPGYYTYDARKEVAA